MNSDDCHGNLCQNGATCMDRINEYSCMCPPAFTGPYCELDVDECSRKPSPCHNGATCTNSPGSYSCICVNGWTGPDCSVNIDDCAGAACFNGATCIDRVGSFYCQCTYGKTGESFGYRRENHHLFIPFSRIPVLKYSYGDSNCLTVGFLKVYKLVS